MTGVVARYSVVRGLFGLAGSAAAHVVAIAGLVVYLKPDPVVDQPMPQSQLDVQAYTLDRTEAQAADPDIAPAAAGDAAGASVDAGAIPTTRAEAAEPRADNVAAATAPVDSVAPNAPDATDLTPAAVATATLTPDATPVETIGAVAPETETLTQTAATEPDQAISASTAAAASLSASAPVVSASVTPVSVTAPAMRPAPPQGSRVSAQAPVILAAAPATPQVTASLRAEAAPLVALPQANAAPTPLPASTDTAEPLEQTPARSQPIAFAPANAQPVANAPTNAQPVPTAQPQAERMVAALAFSGQDSSDVDPVSLNAFQSFMRPGDAVAGGDPLRDGVSGLLAQVPCSRLQVGFDPETATLSVNGHIPEGDLRAPVLAALQAQMGADITVSDNMLILPRPQCGALSGISSVGLPQSTDQITNPLLIGEDTHARVLDFVRDDQMHFDLVAPDYDAWIYVDYFDAGGDVLHLAPNDVVPLAMSPAKQPLRIGTKEDGETGLTLLVGPPYGQEISVAFAASAPLYDGVRPLVEPAAPYLDWLRGRVAQARAEDPDFKGEWVYFFVTTAEN